MTCACNNLGRRDANSSLPRGTDGRTRSFRAVRAVEVQMQCRAQLCNANERPVAARLAHSSSSALAWRAEPTMGRCSGQPRQLPGESARACHMAMCVIALSLCRALGMRPKHCCGDDQVCWATDRQCETQRLLLLCRTAWFAQQRTLMCISSGGRPNTWSRCLCLANPYVAHRQLQTSHSITP